MNEKPVTALALAQMAALFGGHWSTLERLYADDVRYLDPDGELAGRAEVVRHPRELVEALPGCGYEIRRTYSDRLDGVVLEWTLSGKSDGAPITLDVITAYDFLTERIVSERNYWDNAAFLAQLEPAATPAGQ
jgi:hypothetical protein